MPVLDHFGWIAPHYDRFANERDGTRLKELLGLEGSGILMDLGGGTGRAGFSLRDMVRLVIVVDESYSMLVQAKRKPDLLAVCARTEALPFAAGSADFLVMVDALHHVADQRQTANELLRVLLPHGRLVIEEPNIRAAAVKLIAIGERLLGMRSRFLSGDRIAALFAKRRVQTTVRTEGNAVWVTAERSSLRRHVSETCNRRM